MTRIIDLTQEIHPDMQLFPVFPKPSFVLWTKRETYGFETEAMFLVTHTGTHIDAPYHFYAPGAKVDKISLDKLIGEGIVLDFTNRSSKSLIKAQDLRRAERSSRTNIKSGNIVLIRTGWDRFLGKDEYSTSYPGLSIDAAQYLVEKKIGALGVDNPNPDHPDAVDFPVHNTLLPNGILIIENLTNLGAISKPRFKFVGLPLKIRNATGSPIRAVAIED